MAFQGRGGVRLTKSASTPATSAKADIATAQIKKRYTKLAVELITTSLDLLAKSDSESSPFEANTPSESHIEAFTSAFKAAGFSEGYAEEFIGSATTQFQMHDEGRKRKRRLIMFEKRVRQVADTVKQMARDIPREGNAPVSLENGMRVGNGDMRGTATAGGVEQFRRDDEMLFAELQQLVNEGKTWISNAAPLMPPSAQESRWQTQMSGWLDPPPPGPSMPVRADEPSFPNSSGWAQEPPSAQASDKAKVGPITRAALKRDNKASPPESLSQSQSGTPPGLGWGDLLPEPKD